MTMKLNLKVMAGAGALVWMSAVGPVLAADIPAAPVMKAPIAVPMQSWYGSYFGIHGGYGWGRQAINFAPDAAYLPLFTLAGVPAGLAGDPKGFIGGVTYGSNWQFGSVVLGTDSDFSFTDIKSSQNFTGAVGLLPFTATAEQKLKWFGTSRVRAGFLATESMLLYATGGLASGRVSSAAAAAIPGCLVPGACPAGSFEKNKWGWAVGGGVEVASGPWQFRAEYLHFDLGTVNYLIADPTLPGAAIFASNKFSGDIVRGAITYRFNWTLLGLITGRDRL